MNDSFLMLEEQQLSDEGPGLTPLIDVVFQLLIFFMLTSTFTEATLPMQLPGLSQEEMSQAQMPLLLELSASGKLYLEGTELGPNQLGDHLNILSPDQLAKGVAIRADQNAAHGKVLEVLQQLGRAGVSQVGFAYEPDPYPLRP